MERDIEFDLAFHNMRDVTGYCVTHLCGGNLGVLNYFTHEREKFETLCRNKGSRIKWFSPCGWDSMGCEVIPEKKDAPQGLFTVQGSHCLALSPHN